jgi:hypothetical protein
MDFDKTEPRNHNGSGVLEYCSDAADQLQLKVRRPYLCWALPGLPSSFSAVTVNPLITPYDDRSWNIDCKAAAGLDRASHGREGREICVRQEANIQKTNTL